ncbi:MAG: MBL fold metallo-hydrolase [Gammaproteobacteria bacterium]|nr:MBL fold metallo-hydrolase [Gammaproteobacteria bacterium]
MEKNIGYRTVLSVIFIALSALTVRLSFAEQQGVLAVNKVTGSLSVVVLGSGDAMASSKKGRASAGSLIFTDGKPRILMDVGGGTFARIAESGADLSALDTILFSHLHIDHTADTSAVLKTIYLHNLHGKTKRSASTSPINFYGPAANRSLLQADAFDDTSQFIAGMYGEKSGLERYLHGFVKEIGAGEFAYTVTDVSADQFNNVNGETKPADVKTIIHTADGLTVKAIGVEHGPVPSLAYRIEYKGKSIVYSGDTTSNTDNMLTISKSTDILIYDAAIMDDIPPKDSAFRKFHTAPTRMGEIATHAAAKQLVLSHLSSITDTRIDHLKSIVKGVGFKGVITEANDLDVYNIN